MTFNTRTTTRSSEPTASSSTTTEPRYRLTKSCDGTDDIFVIEDAAGIAMAHCVHWDDDPDWTARAFANATLIVDALNAYQNQQRRSGHAPDVAKPKAGM